LGNIKNLAFPKYSTPYGYEQNDTYILYFLTPLPKKRFRATEIMFRTATLITKVQTILKLGEVCPSCTHLYLQHVKTLQGLQEK